MQGTDEHARHDIEFHRETAASYDEETTQEYGIYHSYLLHPFIDQVYRPGAVAVDLGAGTGVVTVALAQRGYRVFAVDHSRDMLEIARRKAADAGVQDRIDFIEGDLRSAPDLPPADVVTVQGVLHHLADPEDGVEAIARALKPGGHFYVSEPCVEISPVGKAIGAMFPLLFAARRAILRRPPNLSPPTVEAPVSAVRVCRSLAAQGLDYSAEFVTHLPRANRVLGDRVRLWLTRLLSWPWRRRRGDLVFVSGRRPAGAVAADSV